MQPILSYRWLLSISYGSLSIVFVIWKFGKSTELNHRPSVFRTYIIQYKSMGLTYTIKCDIMILTLQSPSLNIINQQFCSTDNVSCCHLCCAFPQHDKDKCFFSVSVYDTPMNAWNCEKDSLMDASSRNWNEVPIHMSHGATIPGIRTQNPCIPEVASWILNMNNKNWM